MVRRSRCSYYARWQARNMLGRFTISPSAPKDSDSSSMLQPRHWNSVVGTGSSSTEGSSSGKSPCRSFTGLEGTTSSKRPLPSSYGLEGPSSGKHPRWSTTGILGASSGKNQSHSTSTMGQPCPTSSTGLSRRAFVRACKSPNMRRGIIFVDSSSDSDSTNKNKQAPFREKTKEPSATAKGKQACAREKGKKAEGHCCTLHEWRARENWKEAAGRDKGKQCAGSEKGTEAAARGKGMTAVFSSGKRPRGSSIGIEGPSSSKRHLWSSTTSTKGTGLSHRASIRSRGPSSFKGPRSPNLPRGVIFVDSDSDNMNKQAPARHKGKQRADTEEGKEAAARGKGVPDVSSTLAIPEMKQETQATFRFRKIVVIVRYMADSDDETKEEFMTKSKLIEKAEELQVALKWRSKHVSDSDDSDA